MLAQSTTALAEQTDTEAAHASAVELLSNDEYSKYLLQHRNEMLPVLRGLSDAVSQVTMFFNEGRDMVLTSVVGADEHGVILDVGPSPEMNERALDASKLFCVTQLDKVKIQFVLRGLSRTQADGRPAFKSSLPESILRLQRREYFRLLLPIARPLKATIALESPDGARKNLDVTVADISGGGLGIVGLPSDLKLTSGTEIPLVRMELAEVGIISGRLQVRSASTITNKAGAKTLRLGCQFINLPGTMQNLIQRYIIKIERERKARESGLG
jgi:c-di-GMP-binding flagellar brake protein YcgR